jgi:hypothetical protein
MWQGENVVSPETHKELNESASWTEVVRRGKTRSKSENINTNDRRILEY